MKYNEVHYSRILTHHKIVRVIDGDSIIVQDIGSKKEFEVRLNGIDAPEIKKCAKLLQDERETHLAGGLLMQLGRLSLNYLIELAPPETVCTISIEHANSTDLYGRTLAYIILPNGRTINEMMIEEGYAKPYNRYYCSQLVNYQSLNNLARVGEKGLYSIVQGF